MTDANSYSKTITVTAPPAVAYRAITEGFEHWWTACGAAFRQVGDRGKIAFDGLESYWVFEAVRLEQGRLVELRCVESNMIMLDLPDAPPEEWEGTTVRWQLSASGDGTEVRLEHHGLTPRLDCFDMCSAGWDLFFADSLKAYLDGGQGKPWSAETQLQG